MAEDNIQTPTEGTKKNKGKKKKIIIIAAIIIVALIIVGSLGSNGSENVTNTEANQQSKVTASDNNNTVETEPVTAIQTISDSETIITSTKEVTIKKSEFSYDVMPDNPDSYYSHYAAENGKVYIVLSVDVKNNGKADVMCDELLGVKADYNNGYTYSGFAVVDEGGDLGYANITAISPLTTQAMKYLIECPEEVETSTAPLFLTITIDNVQYQYTIR